MLLPASKSANFMASSSERGERSNLSAGLVLSSVVWVFVCCMVLLLKLGVGQPLSAKNAAFGWLDKLGVHIRMGFFERRGVKAVAGLVFPAGELGAVLIEQYSVVTHKTFDDGVLLFDGLFSFFFGSFQHIAAIYGIGNVWCSGNHIAVVVTVKTLYF